MTKIVTLLRRTWQRKPISQSLQTGRYVSQGSCLRLKHDI